MRMNITAGGNGAGQLTFSLIMRLSIIIDRNGASFIAEAPTRGVL